LVFRGSRSAWWDERCLRPETVRVVRNIVAPHRIQDAGQSARERNHGNALPTPLRDLGRSRAQRRGLLA